jgi:hypothetical protein
MTCDGAPSRPTAPSAQTNFIIKKMDTVQQLLTQLLACFDVLDAYVKAANDNSFATPPTDAWILNSMVSSRQATLLRARQGPKLTAPCEAASSSWPAASDVTLTNKRLSWLDTPPHHRYMFHNAPSSPQVGDNYIKRSPRHNFSWWAPRSLVRYVSHLRQHILLWYEFMKIFKSKYYRMWLIQKIQNKNLHFFLQ